MRKRKVQNFWLHFVMIILLILTFFPFLEMLNISFKNNAQFDMSPWTITLPLYLSNYLRAWRSISPYILNSVIVSGITLIGVLFLSAFSGYVFARFYFPAKEILYYLIISLLMIPGILTLIPLFMLVKGLKLLNTRWALILPWISGGQVFGIFLLRSFMATLPQELFDSARIDGAGDFYTFWYIALPLSAPILGTLGIMNFVGTWNEYIWPLTVLSDVKLFTLPVGLLTFQAEYLVLRGPLFAGYVIASIPLLILFAMASNLFIEGLTSGAIKA